MLTFPEIDPIIISLGPLHVRWYGLMYVLGFLATFLLVQKQIREHSFKALEEHFENLNMVLILCVIIGGRLGYVFFYNFSYYLAHPLEIPATWSGGMSFHGACIAVIIGGALYCRKKDINFWKTADIYAATFPIGLGLGRLGNFINGELYGRVTEQPWGMVFPYAGHLPRHPSQIYEALLEGLLLFLLLWTFRNKPWQNLKYWHHGSITALFWFGYGCIRVFVEFFREPDQQIGFLRWGVTMGQLLSLSMIGCGLLIWFISSRQTRRKSI